MSVRRRVFKLNDASLHPPALSPDGDDSEIPWVLLEDKTYVADCSNDTTAYSESRCGRQVQVTFFATRPPRVSYICVFCRCPEKEEAIPLEPKVVATEDNLVLLRIIVSPEQDLDEGADHYIYRPAGGGGPSLTRLERPRCGRCIFRYTQIGILSLRRAHSAPEPYVVAALHPAEPPTTGRFVLNLYSSKHKTWSIIPVSVEAQAFQRYQQEGCFVHVNTKVIAIRGKRGTIGFVDLWRGILLCHVFEIKDRPWLGYVRLPPPLDPGGPLHPHGDARLSRDIAVVQGHLRYVQQHLHWKPCPALRGEYVIDGWTSAVWTIPIPDDATANTSSWNRVCHTESSQMDVDSNPDFKLLPELDQGKGGPFKRLQVTQPTLSLHGDDHTVCFMIKINQNDAKAWVIAVDMMNNRLQGVTEFDGERYISLGFAYRHSRISKYLKRAPGTTGSQKRAGIPLLRTPSKKQPSALAPLEYYVEHHEAEREGTSAVAEDGDKMIMD